VTYSDERIDQVLEMFASGMSKLAISKATGVSRSAILAWTEGRRPKRLRNGYLANYSNAHCAVCVGAPEELPQGTYAYLLGLYLGDGCLSLTHRDVYRLRIACTEAYPDLMSECILAMSEVLPNKVGRVRLEGCSEIYSHSKHWICRFPQHGPGPKHRRPIVLAGWQAGIVDRYPAPFIRGLIHSDGCRVLNWVNNTPYPRYHFSNTSADIRALFGRACDLLGVDWRPNNATNLSVARRASVALLDQFIGPKH
jgi:hypothetical protein